IQRYRSTAERDGTVELDEVVSVLRLVGRRPDSPLVFADAGRRAARYAARARKAGPLVRASTSGMGRRLAHRSVGRLARRVFGGELRLRPEGNEVEMKDPLSIVAVPDGAACAFYGAAYGELLRLLTHFEGAMLHEQCRSRGAESCVWQCAA